MTVKHFRMRALATTVALGIAVASCASDEADEGSAESAEESVGTIAEQAPGSSVDSTETGATTPTGEPITIGFTYVAEGPLAEPEEFKASAEATLAYVNNDLGGAGGRPIEFMECLLDGTPQSSIKCAQEFDNAGVVAVISGTDFTAESSSSLYQSAGLPYVTLSGNTPALFQNENVVIISQGFQGLGAGTAKFMVEELQAETVAIVTPDILGEDVIENFFAAPLRAAGATPVVIPYSTTSPDLAPAMQAASDAEPDAVLLLANGEGPCIQLQRAAGQYLDGVPQFNANCNEPAVYEELGDEADGVYFQGWTDVASGAAETDDMAAYFEFMELYGPDLDPTAGDVAQVSAMTMTVLNVIMRLGPDVTREQIVDEFNSPDGGPIFLAGTYRCGKVESVPRLCNTQFRIFQRNAGQPVLVGDVWDGSDLIAQG